MNVKKCMSMYVVWTLEDCLQYLYMPTDVLETWSSSHPRVVLVKTGHYESPFPL